MDGQLRAGSVKRLFYALWPDDVTRAALLALQERLQGRKTAYGNLHLTLAFLGHQPEQLLPALKKILSHLPSTALPPMSLKLDRLSYFPRKKIAWAGMSETPEALIDLYQHLTESLLRNNIAFDDKSPFRPHITLARDGPPPPDSPFEPFVWQVRHIALVESAAGAAGVAYQVLAVRDMNRMRLSIKH